MGGNWLGQSFLAILFLVPAWLAIGFFDRNFQIRPDVFLVWYFLGALATFVCFGRSPLGAMLPSWRIIGVLFLIGLTAGGIANLLVFRAVAAAPNPGLPIAIANASSVGVFLASAALSRLVPRYFAPVTFDPLALLGVVLSLVGTSLIALRR